MTVVTVLSKLKLTVGTKETDLKLKVSRVSKLKLTVEPKRKFK